MKVLRRSVAHLFEDYTLELSAEEVIKIFEFEPMKDYIVTVIDGVLRIEDYDGYME